MYVYILQSLLNPSKRYIGSTHNLKKRLQEHNRGKAIFTNKYKPWKLVVAIWFENNEKAFAFEKYLKNGSGYAFAKKHF